MDGDGISRVTSHTIPTDADPVLRAASYSPYVTSSAGTDAGRVDIGLHCNDCKVYVDMRLLLTHRNYHESLKTLKYTGDSRPESVEALVLRRKAVIRKVKKSLQPGQVLDSTQINKINDSFELLKAYIEDTFDVLRQLPDADISDVEATGYICRPRCVRGIGVCTNTNKHWKSSNEDTVVLQDSYGNDPHKCFVGLYDGHHGRYAADMCANHLHSYLLKNMQTFDPRTKCTCTYNMAASYDLSQYTEPHSAAKSGLSDRAALHMDSVQLIHQLLHNCEDQITGRQTDPIEPGALPRDDGFKEKMSVALKKSYQEMDKLLGWGKNEQSKVRWSGCSALTCVIKENDTEAIRWEDWSQCSFQLQGQVKEPLSAPQQLGSIYLANAGDVKAVLLRGNKLYVLSEDHSPKNNKEKTRVLNQGGSVTESQVEILVNGVVPATRSLGNHGDPQLKKCVATEPYTCTVPIDQYAQMLIIGTRGVWQVLSAEEAVKVSSQVLDVLLYKEKCLPQFQVQTPDKVSDSVLKILQNQSKLPHSTTMSSYAPPTDALDRGDVTGNQSIISDWVPETTSNAGDMAAADDKSLVDSEEDYNTATMAVVYAQKMAQRLVQAAILAGATDNISAVVVLLPGYKLG